MIKSKKKNWIVYLLCLPIIAIMGENIIANASNVLIEADKQDYDSKKNLMTFEGNVKVDYENITVKSPKAFIRTSKDGKPEQATFMPNATAIKDKGKLKSQVQAEVIKLSLLEKRIRAIGSTKSVVFENKIPLVSIKARDQIFDTTTNMIIASGDVKIDYSDIRTESEYAQVTIDKDGNPRQVTLKAKAKLFQDRNVISAKSFIYNVQSEELIAQGAVHTQRTLEDNTNVSVWADTQDYDKAANTLMASGNVKIDYKDYTATGPKAMFLPEKDKTNPNRIIFIGRAKINESDRMVEADKIEITIEPKSFKAEGNVKTKIKSIKGLSEALGKESKTPED